LVSQDRQHLFVTPRCTGLSGYIGLRADTTTLCHRQLYPPVRDYEFAYSFHNECIFSSIQILLTAVLGI
jgi:hypothetical protein